MLPCYNDRVAKIMGVGCPRCESRERVSVFCAAIIVSRRSLVAKLEFPKLTSGVRFSSPAPIKRNPVTVEIAGFSFMYQ